MTEQKVHKCPECGAECRCERGNSNPKDCVHYECFTGIAEPEVTNPVTEQKELRPLSPEETVQRVQHVLTLLESITDSNGEMSFESPLPKARVYLRGIIGHGIASSRPADDERVKELARGLADQLFAVEGFGDYTNEQQVQGVAKLIEQTLCLLPVQPAPVNITDLLPSTPDGQICECRCHGYHEVRAATCIHCQPAASPPIAIGVNDRDGHPIHIGDILDFDADEWGEPMQFSVRLEEGQIVHPGTTSDLSAWCRIVKCVAEPAASMPTDRPYCQYCHGKGFITGLERACPYCSPGGEFRAASTPRRYTQPAASTPTEDEIDEVQHRADEVVNTAIEWHQSGREGDNTWFDRAETLGAAIDRLLELREPPQPYESDVDKWKRELVEAGWVAETAIRWRSPGGGLWRGPYGAWVELQRQKHAAVKRLAIQKGASSTPPDFTDGTAIVGAILNLTQADENFQVAWNHSAKVWRFSSSWLDIELDNRSLRPLLEDAVEAIRKAKERFK